jgi:hypothetical protein
MDLPAPHHAEFMESSGEYFSKQTHRVYTEIIFHNLFLLDLLTRVTYFT